MATEFTPEIADAEFSELSRELFTALLIRTLEYGFFKHFLPVSREKVLIDGISDYRSKMRDLVARLMDDNWYILSKEPADNGIPVFIFQRDQVVVLVAGARTNAYQGLGLIFTGESKNDIKLAEREFLALVSPA